jgi:RecA-family ATPase
MKKSIVILFLITNIVAFSQSKKEILIQKWKIDKVEEFGDQFDPIENQKNDWIDFSKDGKFSAQVEGKAVFGSWSAKEAKITLSVNKTLSKTKINWIKEVSVAKDKFSFKYQNGDLISAILIFIPTKP